MTTGPLPTEALNALAVRWCETKAAGESTVEIEQELREAEREYRRAERKARKQAKRERAA
jgi:hypothetical protein